jgi:integrating conjugative element protein (TIGR03757 family)
MPGHAVRIHQARRLVPLCAALICQNAAAEVLVVTDSRHPVEAASGARIVELDLPTRIEAELSATLPADPDRAAAIARQRLDDKALQRRLRQAYQDVADVWGLGVGTIPAVVVDRRFVIYGEADTARAVARIEQYRRMHP